MGCSHCESRNVSEPDAVVQRYLRLLDQTRPFGSESEHGSIRWNAKWYRDRAPLRRTLFRAAGFAVLVVSVSLPFAATAFPTHKNCLLPALAYLIAIVAAVNAFFQWQQALESYTTAELQLGDAWSEWEASRVEAEIETDETKALLIAKTAAAKLLSRASEIIRTETGGFFKNIKFPSIDSGQMKKER